MDVKSEPGVPDGGGVAKKQKTGAPEEAEVLGEGPGVVWQISKVKVGAQKRREKRRGKEERQEKRDRDRERERERERRRKEKSHLLFQVLQAIGLQARPPGLFRGQRRSQGQD